MFINKLSRSGYDAARHKGEQRVVTLGFKRVRDAPSKQDGTLYDTNNKYTIHIQVGISARICI